jgi:two-component system sensor histidine kinase KdpD
MSLTDNRLSSFLANPWRQYLAATLAVVAVSLINLWLQRWTGYETLALIYLLVVVLLAAAVGRGAIFFAAILSALSWDFLFVPTRFSFHVPSLYDKIMIATYLVVALMIGQLTARLRAQHETEVRTKLLAESERLGRTLLNSVSHEFRTPISAIVGGASNLRAEGSLTPSQERFVSEIESAGTRLNRIVQSLLSAARLQSGQLKPNLDWCEARDLVHAALRETAELLKDHPVETKIAPGPHLARMDFVLMQQALSNLLANAAVHTPPKTPVEISARLEGKEMLFQVADRGPGLPGGELERVFDIFHRLPNARPGGTGLGLAIVKGFVEAQGGRVRAANGMNGGAIFNIYMPVSDSPELPEDES